MADSRIALVAEGVEYTPADNSIIPKEPIMRRKSLTILLMLIGVAAVAPFRMADSRN